MMAVYALLQLMDVRGNCLCVYSLGFIMQMNLNGKISLFRLVVFIGQTLMRTCRMRDSSLRSIASGIQILLVGCS